MTVKLTVYSSETTMQDAAEALQRIVGLAEAGQCRINLDRVFRIEEIVAAHRYMDAGHARGKLVVIVD